MRLSSASKSFCLITTTDKLVISCLRCKSSFLLSLPEKLSAVDENSLCKETVASDAEANLGCVISSCERYIAVITTSKRLIVWTKNEEGDHNHNWTPVKIWVLIKRPVDLVFDLKTENILVADKTGDVLQLPVPSSSQSTSISTEVITANSDDCYQSYSQSVVLLGHLSMLLTLNMSLCGKYIITGDRDEKIRVSHYPLAFDIESFCLGHREFISKVENVPSDPSLMLSASGDGNITLWRLKDGTEIHSIDTSKQSSSYCTKNKLEEIDEDESENSGPSNTSESKDNLPSRRRIVPTQCAVVSLVVKKFSCLDDSTEKIDIIATSFDGSNCIAVYKVSNSVIEFMSVVETKSSASTLAWIDDNTLVAVNPSEVSSDCGDKSAPALAVFQWTNSELTPVDDHYLLTFCRDNVDAIKDYPRVDTTILYKERYDNVAEYKKKKQERILLQKQKKLGNADDKSEVQPSKKIKIDDQAI